MLERLRAALGAALALFLAQPAAADVLVRIDKSSQRMTVSVDGEVRHAWPVSTGRAGFGTPNGHFRPQRLARTWFSRKYYNSPMPYSIFFHRGYAIHGTNYLHQLGGPASHGCVRLSPRHAGTLFGLVRQHGPSHTRIVVTGSNPVRIARPARGPAGFSEPVRRRPYYFNDPDAPPYMLRGYPAYPSYDRYPPRYPGYD